jgi:hypothetical protein
LLRSFFSLWSSSLQEAASMPFGMLPTNRSSPFSNLTRWLDGSARDRRESLELQQPWAGDGNPTHTSQTSKRDSQDHSLQENTRKQVTWGSFPSGTRQQPPKHLSRRPCWI